MAIDKILKHFPIQFKKTASLRAEKAYYEQVIKGLEGLNKIRIEAYNNCLNELIAGLVFSKDRAMQLHALLVSYFRRAQNPAPLTVLFKASNETFKSSYQELMSEVQAYPVNFIEESDFYSQVYEWVNSNKADRIFFLTDDAIVIDEFNFQDILQFDPLQNVFSLTKGTDLTFCFNHNRPQELPHFKRVGNTFGNAEYFLEWVWADMINSPDWIYPLSLDGTFFSSREMEVLIKNTGFRNPNSMEANLQVFVRAFLPRKGVCYQKVKYVNIPCNLVQTEVINRTTTTFSVGELNDRWKKGQRIDTDRFWKLEAPLAQKMKFEFK